MGQKCYFNLGCATVCGKCRKRKHREQHPLRTSYADLKANAKIRGVPFTLTLIDWTRFCLRTNYLQLRGRFKTQMTVDRIRVCYDDGTVRGYDFENIQMITKEENNKKQAKDQKEKYRLMRLQVDPNVPF